MNILRGFKEKIVIVSEDISSSILSKQKGKLNYDKDKLIAESVGAAELLKCYQDNWAAIHTDNFNISKLATQVDGSLEAVYTRTLKHYDAYLRLHTEVAEVARLSADLDKAFSLVEELTVSCTAVETALLELEDLVENRELRTREHTRNHELLIQRRETMASLDKRRVQLAQAHAARVAKVEVDKQLEQLERQATFDEEFRRDVEFYREHGHPPEMQLHHYTSSTAAPITTSSISKVTKVTSHEEEKLASVELDNGDEAQEALDSFLNTDEAENDSPGATDSSLPAIIEQEK